MSSRKALALILALCLLAGCARQVPAPDPLPQPDRPFVTDNCTLFFEGNWAECCVAHDRAYWMGGSLEQKARADQELFECVAEKGGVLVAGLMWFGVSWGGFIPWTPHNRWGYGWAWPKYGPLPHQTLKKEKP